MKTPVLIFLIIFCLLRPASAQDTSNSGPHGGTLKKSSNWQVELVDCYEYVEIYVYDLSMVPLFNYGFAGTVQFYYADDTCLTSPTFLYGVDGFSAEVKRRCFLACHITLYKNDIKVTGDFGSLKNNETDCTIDAGSRVK